jgi:hypothetical protein
MGKRISGHPNCARTDESWKERKKEIEINIRRKIKTYIQ